MDPSHTPHRPDVADLLTDQFPGHTMQRMRTIDGKYRYIYVSSGVLKTFGLDPAELMNAPAVDHGWIHPEDRPRFLDELEQSARDLTPLDIEVRVESLSGGYRWVRSLGQPRRQPDGATIWDGVALDVTDRREALNALERAMDEARRSEVAEGRFAYIAAQDLSGPLGALRTTIADLQSADAADTDRISPLIADLAQRFSDFEIALSATKDLVAASQSDPATKLPEADDRLTRRQQEILTLIRDGDSNRMIAAALGISEGTVKLHVSAILKKLDVRNRTEAVRAGLKR
ncbi:LuxR C-terminal-related transcriptional regulator [Roseobacter sp. YSTF-M11]|uniref:LuxR C-terminal-related transcriptional regulator n=1 Tax=Roseobacter insulae TaxID=2859783 RepID=A0A9X1FRL9_9RHOB|nr:LuxR C-terminal-related transcriptional regulator [Roseobacter insulae]MBW4706312.1 LuxR C-terminal-related transcriptional regulator [Roseobacter insulae]